MMLSDIFSREGLKLLATVFTTGFFLGGAVAIIGFTLAVDAMAK
jgi:hypothetical protein